MSAPLSAAAVAVELWLYQLSPYLGHSAVRRERSKVSNSLSSSGQQRTLSHQPRNVPVAGDPAAGDFLHRFVDCRVPQPHLFGALSWRHDCVACVCARACVRMYVLVCRVYVCYGSWICRSRVECRVEERRREIDSQGTHRAATPPAPT